MRFSTVTRSAHPMRARVVSLLAVTAAAVVACKSAQTASPSPKPSVSPKPEAAPSAPPTVAAQPAGAPTGAPGQPGAGGPPRRPRPTPAQLDTLRRGMVAKVLSEIAGRENEPAEKVFQNIKLWKGVPAKALLDTMNSYGRAIGGTCTSCHIPDQWASETRKNKVITRQMQAMVNTINKDQLSKMPELDEDHPPATCAMCHAGSSHPKKDVDLSAPNAAPPMRPPGN